MPNKSTRMKQSSMLIMNMLLPAAIWISSCNKCEAYLENCSLCLIPDNSLKHYDSSLPKETTIDSCLHSIKWSLPLRRETIARKIPNHL
jgi:hypothetical protein